MAGQGHSHRHGRPMNNKQQTIMTFFEIGEEDAPQNDMVCNLNSERRERLFNHYARQEGVSPLRESLTLKAKLLVFNPCWLVLTSVVVVADCAWCFALGLLFWYNGATLHAWEDQRRKAGLIFDALVIEFIWLCFLTPVYLVNQVCRIKVFRRGFFSRPASQLDCVVTVACMWILITEFWCPCDQPAFPYLDWTCRFSRFLPGFFIVYKVWNCPAIVAVRRLVSGNKRRYVSISEDLDLDLTYITPRVIAFAAPCTKWSDLLFRNLYSDVVRFFETRHPGKYLIINCCPEKPYPTEAFESGRIVHFDIQDHTPPTMSQYLEFLALATEWLALDPDNILAVHCMGGKGRTGSFVTAYLLFSGVCSSLHGALEVFALARTQLRAGTTLVGVETPSQLRYLWQLNDLLANRGYFIEREMKTSIDVPTMLKPIPPAILVPQRIILHKIFTESFVKTRCSKKSQLIVALHRVVPGEGHNVVWWSDPFEAEANAVQEFSVDCDALEGDIRISVFKLSRLLRARQRQPSRGAFRGDDTTEPGKPLPRRCKGGNEPGCLFFCVFHSAFAQSDGTMRVPIGPSDGAEMDGMDTAYHKPRLYNMRGWVEMQSLRAVGDLAVSCIVGIGHEPSMASAASVEVGAEHSERSLASLACSSTLVGGVDSTLVGGVEDFK